MSEITKDIVFRMEKELKESFGSIICISADVSHATQVPGIIADVDMAVEELKAKGYDAYRKVDLNHIKVCVKRHKPWLVYIDSDGYPISDAYDPSQKAYYSEAINKAWLLSVDKDGNLEISDEFAEAIKAKIMTNMMWKPKNLKRKKDED